MHNRLFKIILKKIDPLKAAKREGMKVGKRVTLASKEGNFFGSEPYLITLEDEVRISGGVKFLTHDGGTWVFRDKEGCEDIIKFGPIKVGERTFIGYGVTILPGVSIGKRCVIGAGAIVTHDIPDECVVAGIPAKIICSKEEYRIKCKEKFEEEKHDMVLFKKDKKKYLVSKYMEQ